MGVRNPKMSMANIQRFGDWFAKNHVEFTDQRMGASGIGHQWYTYSGISLTDDQVRKVVRNTIESKGLEFSFPAGSPRPAAGIRAAQEKRTKQTDVGLRMSIAMCLAIFEEMGLDKKRDTLHAAAKAYLAREPATGLLFDATRGGAS